MRAEFQTARELGEQLLSLAQSVQDPAPPPGGPSSAGEYLVLRWESWPPAREHLEQGIALYDPQQHRSLCLLSMGIDPGVCLPPMQPVPCGLLAIRTRLCKRSHEALTLAQELSHPFSLAFALYFAAWLHQYRREGQAAQERAEAAITLSTEQGFPFWLALGTILRGWALAEQGQGEAFRGRVFKQPEASQEFLSVCYLEQFAATAPERSGRAGDAAD